MHNISKFHKNTMKMIKNTKLQIIMKVMSNIKTKCAEITKLERNFKYKKHFQNYHNQRKMKKI